MIEILERKTFELIATEPEEIDTTQRLYYHSICHTPQSRRISKSPLSTNGDVTFFALLAKQRVQRLQQSLLRLHYHRLVYRVQQHYVHRYQQESCDQ